MNLFRRLLPKAQEARCTGCGVVLRERRRKPCPGCGETRRTITRGMDLGRVTVTDRMG
ncbi:MAG: hypothetical protein V4515_12400 [Chloroflexota bacterium]